MHFMNASSFSRLLSSLMQKMAKLQTLTYITSPRIFTQHLRQAVLGNKELWQCGCECFLH